MLLAIQAMWQDCWRRGAEAVPFVAVPSIGRVLHVISALSLTSLGLAAFMTFLDYLQSLCDAELPPSALVRASHALMFMERAGNVPVAAQLSQHPLLKAAIQEYLLTESGGSTKAVRKAPQLPVAFVMAFERIIMSTASPMFL